MKVLIVLNWLTRGGIETMFLVVVPELQRRGIHLDFCCLGGPAALDDQFRQMGCRLFHFPRKTAWERGYREVGEILRRENYDIVHSQFGYTSAGIVRAASEQGVPAIVSIHSMGPAMKLASIPLARTVRRMWLNWHRRRTVPLVHQYLGVAETCLDAAVPDWKSGAVRCRVLHNGVRFPATLPGREEVRRSLNIDPGAICLLHVGSYRREKNHRGLLDIHRRVLRQLPHAKLLLVGDGPDRHVLQSEVGSGPLRDSVMFLGAQNNVWPYYSAADVFVFPSFSEGSPNSLAEAMGSGLPVVASRIPSHLEAVPPSLHQFLFDLPDYQRAADLVLEQFEANRQGKSALVQESENIARDRFSFRRHVEELASLYESLANRSERRAA